MSDKKRHTIWIDDDIWQELLCIYKRDNCSTQNEFVENALRFYIGYLNTKNAGAFLPEVLSDMLQGTLDHYAQRIGSVIFKQGVDINVLSQIIAYDTDIDEGEYQQRTDLLQGCDGFSKVGISSVPHGKIVAFVEFSFAALLSIAIRLFFRYCVFAKTETKEEQL